MISRRPCPLPDILFVVLVGIFLSTLVVAGSIVLFSSRLGYSVPSGLLVAASVILAVTFVAGVAVRYSIHRNSLHERLATGNEFNVYPKSRGQRFLHRDVENESIAVPTLQYPPATLKPGVLGGSHQDSNEQQSRGGPIFEGRQRRYHKDDPTTVESFELPADGHYVYRSSPQHLGSPVRSPSFNAGEAEILNLPDPIASVERHAEIDRPPRPYIDKDVQPTADVLPGPSILKNSLKLNNVTHPLTVHSSDTQTLVEQVGSGRAPSKRTNRSHSIPTQQYRGHDKTTAPDTVRIVQRSKTESQRE
ncbi:hypothetical protein MMC19_003596 [Ptychographa xylographoides]|nr:hypothetical protein [Ptychographa xylographoides]